MGIEIKIECDECNRKIQLDDVIYCYECVEKLKKITAKNSIQDSQKNSDKSVSFILSTTLRYKLLWIIIGLPRILYGAIKNWIKRDRKWCKFQGIGFKRIWKNEWRLQTDNDKES